MSTKKSFTPGPWIIDRDKYLVSLPDSRIVGHVADSTQADAHLIAAAPEMAEALDKALALIARGYVDGAYTETVGGDAYAKRVMDGISFVLAKARGES